MHFYEQTFLFFVFAAAFMLLIFGFSGNSAIAGNANGANGLQANSLIYSAGAFFASAQASALFFALAVLIVAFYGAYWIKSN